MFRQNPILPDQGDQICKRAQGNEVQKRPKLLSRFLTEQRLKQLEGDSHPTQVFEWVGTAGLTWIEDGGGGGGGGRRGKRMLASDYVYAPRPSQGDRLAGGDSVIHRDENPNTQIRRLLCD